MAGYETNIGESIFKFSLRVLIALRLFQKHSNSIRTLNENPQ